MCWGFLKYYVFVSPACPTLMVSVLEGRQVILHLHTYIHDVKSVSTFVMFSKMFIISKENSNLWAEYDMYFFLRVL